MRRLLRLAAAAALGIITAGATATALPARAATNVVPVGVDNASPSGHNFEYVDYFPRQGIDVMNGADVVDFKWNTGASDGLHTVTFLRPGATAPSFAKPDGDDSPQSLQVDGAAFGPQFGGPGAPPCGDTAANACTYDGSSTISSGARPTAPGGDFFVTFALGARALPQTLTYQCLIHPGMQGSVNVTSTPGSLAPAVSLLAAAQYATTTTAALAKEAATNNSSVTTNPDGTHTLAMTAGTAVQYVEILEMLPNNVSVQAGDKVKWTTTTINDIHTVTFPTGSGSNSVDPFGSPVCEGVGTVDNPASGGPPGFGCAPPTSAELPLFPQPQGPTAISSPTTVATSGIIGAAGSGAPSDYAFSFPATGSFLYQCRIHDHMTGIVVVSAAVAPTTPGIPVPTTGGASAAAPPGGGGAPTWLLSFTGAALLLALSVVGLVRTRRITSAR